MAAPLYSHALTVRHEQAAPPRPRPLPRTASKPRRHAKDAAARAVAAATRLIRSGAERSVASVLDTQLRRMVWREHGRAVEAMLRARSLPPDRVRQLGRWFATHGEHPNAVRFGILLLGMAGTDDDAGVLTTLGVFWAFSTACCAALTRSQTDPHRALFDLARRAEGWARVDAVRGLEGASDPAIKEWLIRESCTGDVLDSYFALTAARVGDLAGALARGTPAEAAMDGAGRLLQALTDVDGPGPALASYDDAPQALNGYLHRSTAGGVTLRRVWTLLSIHRYLQTYVGTAGREQPEWRHLRHRYARLIADPATRQVVLDGLAGDAPATVRLAAWAAQRMDIPIRPALLRGVESAPYDGTMWFLLVDGCPGEDIAAVVAAAVRLLPLQDLRTGPTPATGLGEKDGTDGLLDMIVSRLDAHPGHGWELLETALDNRTSRNRRMALRAIRAWPADALPPQARGILLAAAEKEPLPELRAEMESEAARL
ncbi:hypothetical protein [Streptomyces sp. NPDC005435]|uniref:hypothetical protein n=1 Tax=Streptomyces sp. NPDC005435 TaxID=3154464 RepID=UPI003451A105